MTLDLDNLARLEAAATPGPWGTEHDGVHVDEMVYCQREDNNSEVCSTYNRHPYEHGHAESAANALLIAAMRNALPALLADHARLEAEAALATDLAYGAEAIRLRAELTTERDAHQATRDALARERAERVGRAEFDALRAEADRLRDIIEAMNPEHNYMALLDLYMERARDAEAEVARLRGLLPTVVRKLEYLLRDYPGDKETAGLIESIRKEAAGE